MPFRVYGPQVFVSLTIWPLRAKVLLQQQLVKKNFDCGPGRTPGGTAPACDFFGMTPAYLPFPCTAPKTFRPVNKPAIWMCPCARGMEDDDYLRCLAEYLPDLLTSGEA